MCNDFYIIKDWLELIAYIATIVGVISVFIAVITIFKNKPTKKHFKVEFIFKQTALTIKGILITAELDFINFTNKEFNVTAVLLCVNGERFPVMVRSNYNEVHTTLLKNIQLTSHSSASINECFIYLPESLSILSAFLEVETTVGDFIYGVDVGQLHNEIEKVK